MGLIDVLGNPNHTVLTRITEKEKKYLDEYKEQQDDEPSYTKVLRIALMEFLERNLKPNKDNPKA